MHYKSDDQRKAVHAGKGKKKPLRFTSIEDLNNYRDVQKKKSSVYNLDNIDKRGVAERHSGFSDEDLKQNRVQRKKILAKTNTTLPWEINKSMGNGRYEKRNSDYYSVNTLNKMSFDDINKNIRSMDEVIDLLGEEEKYDAGAQYILAKKQLKDELLKRITQNDILNQQRSIPQEKRGFMSGSRTTDSNFSDSDR